MRHDATFRPIARRVILLSVTLVALTLTVGGLVALYAFSHSADTIRIAEYHSASIRHCSRIKDEAHRIGLVLVREPTAASRSDARDVGASLFVVRSATAELAGIQGRYRGAEFVRPVQRVHSAMRELGAVDELMGEDAAAAGRKVRQMLDSVEQLQRLHVVAGRTAQAHMASEHGSHLAWLSLFGALLLGACILGSRRYLLSIRQVIDDREAAHRAAHRSHERLVRAQRVAGMGSWEWNVSTDQVLWSSELSVLLGEPAEERSRTLEESLEWVHPDDREEVGAALSEARESDLLRTTLRARLRDGRVRHLVCDAARDAGSQRFTGMMLDVTQLASAHDERRELERQVQHSEKLTSLGVLAGGIAHDFNNLLVGVLGNAKLVRMGLEPGSKPATRVDRVIRSAERAAELCHQLLAYAGRGQFVVEPLDLSQVIADVGPLLELSVDKRARISYELAEGLPAVEADPSQLRQVAMNLIMNASDAVAETDGAVTVTTGRMHCDAAYLEESWVDNELPSGDYVYLEVADTGCGIPADQLPRIFDPFFTSKSRGHGLGLAATLGIVRSHAGTLSVKSEIDAGTRIRVLFPAGEVLAPERGHGDRAHRMPRGIGTVLVVDDEESVRELARDTLEEAGLLVLTADDGREGVDAYRSARGRIDVVLLDLTMPEMGGEATLRELRKLNPGVRVILSSGYSAEDTAEQLRGQRPAGFLRKPYAPTELLEMVLEGAREVGTPAAAE